MSKKVTFVPTPIRRKPFRNYLIFYAVHRETVEVIHAARDYMKILSPGE